MMNERWLPFPGYEGLYEISDHGRCRSASLRRGGRRIGSLLAPRPHAQSGYIRFELTTEPRKRKKVLAHVAVAEAFLPPRPSPLHNVAHEDGTRDNNHWENLRWKTQKENLADCERHGTKLHGEKNYAAKLTLHQVRQMRKLHTQGVSRQTLLRQFSISYSQAVRIIKGKSWRSA